MLYLYFCIRIQYMEMDGIADMLKQKRKELNLPLSELSARTNLDISLLSRFENGKRIPTPEQCVKLGLALQIDTFEVRRLRLQEQILRLVEEEDPLIAKTVMAGIGLIKQARSEGEWFERKEKEKQKQLIDLVRLWRILKRREPLRAEEIKQLQVFQFLSSWMTFRGRHFNSTEIKSAILEKKTHEGKSLQDYIELQAIWECIGYCASKHPFRSSESKQWIWPLNRLGILPDVEKTMVWFPKFEVLWELFIGNHDEEMFILSFIELLPTQLEPNGLELCWMWVNMALIRLDLPVLMVEYGVLGIAGLYWLDNLKQALQEAIDKVGT